MPKLTTIKIRSLPDGRHSDGNGLYYRKRGGSVRWIFRYQRNGVVRDVVLGGAEMTLAEAREAALEARKRVRAGIAPATASPPSSVTLEASVEDFIRHAAGGWRSRTEERHTENQLRCHFGHLYDRPVTAVTKADVLAVMKMVWDSPAVADRLLSRISRVLGRAAALDLIPANPADARMIRALLPRRRREKTHHPAVPVAEAPAFYARLCKRGTLAALCLRLIVLTATRSGEARNADWSEFDRNGSVWRIPASRTKTNKVLEVPLCPSVLSLLATVPRFRSPLVFPGRTGRPITDMAVLKEMKLLRDEYSVHGWRSTFRDWGGAQRFDRDLLELSLGHAVGGAVERAYARSSHTELRRPIMVAWENYLLGFPQPSNVLD